MIDLPGVAEITAPDLRYVRQVQRLRNDPGTALLLINRATPSSAKAIEEWIASFQTPGRHLFFVISTDGEDFLGYIAVSGIDLVSRVANVGIALTERARGQGLGSACIAAIADHCKNALGLHKLVAQVLTENDSSRRLFVGQDFVEVGILRDHFFAQGRYWDVAILERIFSERSDAASGQGHG